MEKDKMVSKNEYLKTVSWESIYAITKHWQSDMDFYTVEIQFLKKLIKKYFIWITDDKYVAEVEQVRRNLKKFNKENNGIKKMMHRHLSHINSLIENTFSTDEQEIREDHALLEMELAKLTKTFKVIKKEVFHVTEEVLSKENLNIFD